MTFMPSPQFDCLFRELGMTTSDKSRSLGLHWLRTSSEHLAGIQCADRGGQSFPNHRSGGADAGGQRQAAVGAPILAQVEQNLGKKPEHATADTGYFSEAAVADPKVKGVNLLVPPERQKKNELSGVGTVIATDAAPQAEQLPAAKSAAETMRDKLSTTAGKAVYKMRKAVVEPVFGQIKAVRGLRSLSMRGLEKAAAEWQIICLTHNLLKLFRAGLRPQIA